MKTMILALVLLPAAELSAAGSGEIFEKPAVTSVDSLNTGEVEGGHSGSFWQALVGGRVTLSNRSRVELVEMEGLQSATALTNRLQLGYGSRPFYGLSVFADFVDVRAIADHRYNAAGLNDQPDRAVVADPELTILNQLYGQFEYEPAATRLRVGRQRIIHHDARFMGNVGWRQNEQTYDAANVSSSLGIDGLEAEYGYIWSVRRIFGPDHPMGVLDSDSHIAHVTHSDIPGLGMLSGFFYRLGFSDAPQLSSTTYGARIEQELELSDHYTAGVRGGYARQTDSGNQPQSFSADYYRFDVSLDRRNFGHVGLSYEVLGSDGGQVGFQTPLATLHAWQGWADVWLSTPDRGLEDLSARGQVSLPAGIEALMKVHWYYDNLGDLFYGREFNLSLQKRVNDHWGLLVKFAEFQGREGIAGRTKFWLQSEIRF